MSCCHFAKLIAKNLLSQAVRGRYETKPAPSIENTHTHTNQLTGKELTGVQ